MNTIGTDLRLTIFGGSHAPCVGCILDGAPAGIEVSEEDMQREVDLRRPSGALGTPRHEEDKVVAAAGLLDGRTTGAPIAILIWNKDTDSSKYERFRTVPRPGHADYTAYAKYGRSHDGRGGGQFSGRMTAPLTAAGAVAKEILRPLGVQTAAYARSVGSVVDEPDRSLKEARRASRENPVRAADPEVALRMIAEIMKAKDDQDSVGGTVRFLASGLPLGAGEPFFGTLEGELARMMFAIPGVKGVEFGCGFRGASMRGSEHNDPFVVKDGEVSSPTNNSGGVLGGMSSGLPLDMTVAFKPTASIPRPQASVDVSAMEPAQLAIEGRHDPCIVPRAVAAVEAAGALVLADLCMRGGYVSRGDFIA